MGYSKERRVDPQIVVGLLVDRTGFPLEIGCFEGNTAETTTIVPIIEDFLDRHDVHDRSIVVAADAGMLSASDLAALDEAKLSFIVGSRVTKAPGDLESHFHWNGDVFSDGQLIDTVAVTPRHGNIRVNDTKLRAEPVWDPQQHPGAWRAIWSYSAKRARRDQKTLTAQEDRARTIVAGEKNAKTSTIRQEHRYRPSTRRGQPGPRPIPGRAQGLHDQRAGIADAGHRSHREIPRPLACREIVSDVEVRPRRQAHVQPQARRHRSPPDHRVRRPRCRPRHPVPHRTIHRQSRQTTPPLRTATITINGATQTFPPEIPDTERKILTDLGVTPGY